MRHATDTQARTHTAKAEPGSDAYKQRVAVPVMEAIDAMPPAFRALVKEFDYVDVYRAWRRGWTPQMVLAKVVDGRFELS